MSATTPCYIEWCKYTAEHHAEYDSEPEDGVLHGTVAMGRFQGWQYENNPRYPDATATLVEGIGNSDDFTVDDLRELAAEALSIVAWIEANAPRPIRSKGCTTCQHFDSCPRHGRSGDGPESQNRD